MFSGGFDAFVDEEYVEDDVPEEDFPDYVPPQPAEVTPAASKEANAAPDTPEETQPLPTPAAFEAPPAPEPVKAAPVAVKEEPTIQQLLDTPRTREAYKRSGIRKADLAVKSFQDFYISGDLQEKQQLRFTHYEARRQDKLNIVLRERARVISEQGNLSGAGDAANYQSLQLMEGLLDTEAKRLEKTLRAQLRYHQAVEKENVLQLDKEMSLQSKLGYRKERTEIAKSQFDAKSKQLQEILTAKKKHAHELQVTLEQQAELKKVEAYNSMLDTEVRLQKFEKEKSIKNAEKSEKWKAKCKLMQERKEEADLKKEIIGHQQLEHLYDKIEQIEKKKEVEDIARRVKHQEESLRLVDAKEKIERLKRQDEFRRNLIRENLDGQEERIDTLLKLREQILEQRKVRIKQRAVVKGRPQNIRNSTPGPGQYALPSCLNEMPVTKISDANSLNLMPGSIDMMIKKSKSLPPPGAYDPQVLPDGNHLAMDVIDGCKTRIVKGAGKRKLFTDDVVKTYKENPGPGTYESTASYNLRHSVRIVRDYVDTSDKPPKWCKPAEDMPGPDEYVLDKFTKAGRAKAATSTPHLAGALRMASR
jgi:hypothetical protein